MGQLYNIYCDESCHLEHDGENAMTIGGIWCLQNKKDEIFHRIREIKKEHGLSKSFEIKWNKVSPGQLYFYMDIVNYFFEKILNFFHTFHQKDFWPHQALKNCKEAGLRMTQILSSYPVFLFLHKEYLYYRCTFLQATVQPQEGALL